MDKEVITRRMPANNNIKFNQYRWPFLIEFWFALFTVK